MVVALRNIHNYWNFSWKKITKTLLLVEETTTFSKIYYDFASEYTVLYFRQCGTPDI
jgi:hypothetical protein